SRRAGARRRAEPGTLRVPLERPVRPRARPGDRARLPRRDPAAGGGQDRALLLDVRPALLLDEDHRGGPPVRGRAQRRRARGARRGPRGEGARVPRPGRRAVPLNVARGPDPRAARARGSAGGPGSESATAPARAARRLRARALLALVLLAAFAAYAPSLANGYAFDDRFIALPVRDDGSVNTLVAELHPPAAYFKVNYWHGVYPADVLYRPVTTWSIALLHAAFGRGAADEYGQAFPQHLANVLLHVLATWLTYRVARAA